MLELLKAYIDCIHVCGLQHAKAVIKDYTVDYDLTEVSACDIAYVKEDLENAIQSNLLLRVQSGQSTISSLVS